MCYSVWETSFNEGFLLKNHKDYYCLVDAVKTFDDDSIIYKLVYCKHRCSCGECLAGPIRKLICKLKGNLQILNYMKGDQKCSVKDVRK